jgi:hypothetical protein
MSNKDNFKLQFLIFIQIIRNNLKGFYKRFFMEFLACFIDSGSWLIGYSLINPGKSIANSEYGLFILIGIIGTNAMWKLIPKITLMINDITNEKTITYFLTLPINTNIFFISMAISWTIETTFLSFIFSFLGKIIFFEQINIINYLFNIKFIASIIINNFFFSFIALFLIGYRKNTYTLIPLIISPSRAVCFLTKWKLIFSIYKIFGILMLINPVLYSMEGIRASVFGDENFISWWICSLFLIILSIIFGHFGIKRLKSKLDTL